MINFDSMMMSCEKHEHKVDSNCKLKDNLNIGDKVNIVRDGWDGTYFEGKIVQFLEKNKNYDECGIRVTIDNGMRGHAIKLLTNKKMTKENLFELLRQHEDKKLELKQSYCHNVDKTKNLGSFEMWETGKKIICKVMSAFMNTNDGKICIGISDELKFYGFDIDFKLLFKNKYETMNLIEMTESFKHDLEGQLGKYLGHSNTSHHDVHFFTFTKDEIKNNGFEIDDSQNQTENFHICMIDVPKVEKPVFFREFVDGKTKDGEPAKGFIIEKYVKTAHDGKHPLQIDDFIDELS